MTTEYNDALEIDAGLQRIKKIIMYMIVAIIASIITIILSWQTVKNRIINFHAEPEITWCREALK